MKGIIVGMFESFVTGVPVPMNNKIRQSTSTLHTSLECLGAVLFIQKNN